MDMLLTIVQKINFYLSDYILIALLIGTGLFFTVKTRFVQIRYFPEAMKKAFGGIASDVAAGAKPVVLAQGVSQAIVTTILGLVVAIPALVAHAFLRRRAAKRVAELEEAVEEILGGVAK